ncbi:serine/threonine-protein kinase Nek10 [Xenentodon cancila]
MSNSAKKVGQGEKLPLKSAQIHSSLFSRTSYDLRRLLSLLAKSSSRQEAAAWSHSKARSSRASSSQHSPKHSSRHGRESYNSSEAVELEKFSIAYKEQRCFSSHPLNKLFSDILASLVKNRLCSDWIDYAPPESVLQVLICLRLLIRDPNYQIMLHQLQGIDLLARYLESATAMYLSCGEQEFAAQKLVTMTYMFQKLSVVENQRVWVIQSGAHRNLAKLLYTTDSSVMLGALSVLTSLAVSPECKEALGKLPIVESLLVILQEYDLLSRRMSAELLRLLCPVQQVRDQVKDLDGVPVLLSLLHGQHLKLLWSIAWVLVQLCEDPDTRTEIRSWGGVQQLLRLLNSNRQYVSDHSSIETFSSADAANCVLRDCMKEELSSLQEVDKTAALHSACCTALTEMSLDDASAHQIVQENGIYIIAKLILPRDCGPKATSLQCYVFRTLRFLFSVERNRRLFKRLFPTELFELFIDVGHYVRDLAAYEGLQTRVSLYTEEEIVSLRQSIEAVDQNQRPLRVINSYSILDHLGSGAFGSVFKVQKQSSQNLLALKEVNLHNPAFGRNKKSRDTNVEKIISELTIVKEQMMHPNIVKYYKTFLEGEKLYIVMELIEGVPLAEHLNSLKQKQQQLTEDRIWKVFIQMCLALRYLHKEKRIVHRDLTPNNIMIGEKDKVTITDFGLAKQKQENSKLTSVVGSILYSCPEVVKNEPYGEKADVWALGCILYQMAALQPPFYSSNMLSLASKIVEAFYEPITEGAFSDRVTEMIRWCLSPDPDQRPDIVAVSSRISDLMMRMMDGLYTTQNALERRAERDRKQAQIHFLERHKTRMICSHSYQERRQLETDCLAQSSSGGSGSNSGKQGISQASTGICVSQKILREIDDPVQKLLVQLHKIIFITQLPPAAQHNSKRRLIERFKKSLFQIGSSPYNLKVELSKVVQASPELVELSSPGSDWWPLVQHFTSDADSTVDGNLKDGVTYQRMQEIIEELVDENGYHEATQNK